MTAKAKLALAFVMIAVTAWAAPGLSPRLSGSAAESSFGRSVRIGASASESALPVTPHGSGPATREAARRFG